MRTFRDSISTMLSGGLTAQAKMEGFQIEDSAVDFIVKRAVGNIERSTSDEASQYKAAVRAISDLPKFFARLKRQSAYRQYSTETAAAAAIRTLTTDCIYPWCTDRP